MPDFVKGPAFRTPFGPNVFLRSTVGLQFEHYTLYAPSVPYETIDGSLQRVLKKGEVLAKITSGPGTGKVGPFQAAGSAAKEVQTITKNGSDTYTAGTYTITVLGVTTTPIPYNATAAQVQTYVDAALGVSGAVVVTGGPLGTTALTLTYWHPTGDVTQATADVSNVTGQTGAAAGATTTAGVAGASDGRQTATNIVGLNNTFLPWQLMERDVEVAALYRCTAVQAWCFERDAGGSRIALTNTTADAMRSVKTMDVTFH